MPTLFISIASGLVSASIAILSSILVEKLGGVLGGALSTTPLLGLAFSIGLALSDDTSLRDLELALFSIPCALAVTGVYLSLWREAPTWTSVQKLSRYNSYLGLAVVTTALVAMWMIGAVLLVFALPWLVTHGMSIQAAGAIGTIVLFFTGFWGLMFRNPPAPSGKNKVTLTVYLLRGIMSGAIVFTAMLLSKLSPTLAGVASVFPAISSTIMISLWLSQGPQVPRGAVNTIILGNVAVCVYYCLFAVMFNDFIVTSPFALTLFAAVLVCFIVSTFFVSLPIFWLIRACPVKDNAATTPNDQLEFLTCKVDPNTSQNSPNSA